MKRLLAAAVLFLVPVAAVAAADVGRARAMERRRN